MQKTGIKNMNRKLLTSRNQVATDVINVRRPHGTGNVGGGILILKIAAFMLSG